jgi:hypothetical protein
MRPVNQWAFLSLLKRSNSKLIFYLSTTANTISVEGRQCDNNNNNNSCSGTTLKPR